MGTCKEDINWANTNGTSRGPAQMKNDVGSPLNVSAMMSSPSRGGESRRPLLYSDEEQEFTAYDDDDLQAAAKLRRRRQRTRACAWMTLGVLAIAAVGTMLFLLTNGTKKTGSTEVPLIPSDPTLGKYKHAAVASDVTLCSKVGSDIMEHSEGNAVDAAVASLLCMGIADPQSMGIGGGFFMTIYNKTSGKSFTIDARETAPGGASRAMFYNGTSSLKGGLSIAVPGEIRGYEMAMKMAGTLSWSEVFQPTIKMAEEGFPVPQSLEEALSDFVSANGGSVDKVKEKYPQFYDTYVNPSTGDIYKEGDTLKLPTIGKTLKILADEGPDAFYNGSLTADILEDMKREDSKCIITKDDLLKYKPLFDTAEDVTLSDGSKIFAPTAPSSGVLLMFMLNVLDGFKITPDQVKTKEGKILALHRIIETFKFAYAKRTDLGDLEDPTFNKNISQLIRNLTTRAYADSVREMIWDNQTHPLPYYGPTFYDDYTTSTAHLSLVDKDGNAVSVTSTVNARFGSNIIGLKTGIIFNDEMDDFATSDKPNDFGIYPSPANQIKPGKRPLSSMCPAVIVDKEGVVKLVVGAAGGSRITTATTFVAARALWFGENIEEAIDALRLHHQLLPQQCTYEEGFDMEIVNGLKDKGHNMTETSIGSSIVQGIMRKDGILYANSDYRKGGRPAGF